MKKILKMRPMYIPPPGTEFPPLEFIIPPSEHETKVHIEVWAYQGKDARTVDVRPFLGDRFVPPNLFAWMGMEYELTPQSWKILHLLVSSEEHRMKESEMRRRLRTSSDLVKPVQRLNEELQQINDDCVKRNVTTYHAHVHYKKSKSDDATPYLTLD